MEIRLETPADMATIRQIILDAFAGAEYSSGTEGAIIDGLRAAGTLTLSLVAVENGRIIGHAAFSPVAIAGRDAGWSGLGPVSVRPDRQGKGTGAALIRVGLSRLRDMGQRAAWPWAIRAIMAASASPWTRTSASKGCLRNTSWRWRLVMAPCLPAPWFINQLSTKVETSPPRPLTTTLPTSGGLGPELPVRPVLRCAAAFARAATWTWRSKILVGKVAVRQLQTSGLIQIQGIRVGGLLQRSTHSVILPVVKGMRR